MKHFHKAACAIVFPILTAMPLSGCVRTGFGDDMAELFRCRQNCETPGPARTLSPPRLSANGGLVVMPVQYKLANQTNWRGKLAIYDVNGRTWRYVALPDGIVAIDVTFSPDGKRAALSLVCRSNCSPGTRGGQIALTDLPFAGDGQLALRYLTHDESHAHSKPRFNADGGRIAYSVTRVYWQKDGSFTTSFSNIAATDADGGGGELILSTDEFLQVDPAGFSASGEAVFVGLYPHGQTQVMLQAHLAATGDKSSWTTVDAPYVLSATATSQPRIADGFARLGVNYLSCATDCGKAVFIARRDPEEKRYYYELFFAEDGQARPLTHFDQEGAPLWRANISADGHHALVVNKGVPVRVEVATGRVAPVPAPDFAAIMSAP
jgi:hypothetical protein